MIAYTSLDMANGVLVRLKGETTAEDLWPCLLVGTLSIGYHEISLTQILGQREESCDSVGRVERSG